MYYYLKDGFDAEHGPWIAIARSETQISDLEDGVTEYADEKSCRDYLTLIFSFLEHGRGAALVDRLINIANKKGHHWQYWS